MAARLLGCAVMALASATLLGWWLDIPVLRSVWPGFVAMRPHTAVGFLLCGAGLLAACCVGRGPRRLARLLGVLVALLGTVALSQNLSGLPLSIGGLSFAGICFTGEAPSGMATMTAWCFVLCGTALASGSRRLGQRVAHACALGLGFVAMLSLFGYLFDAETLQNLGGYRSMALHAVIGWLMVATGLLLVLPGCGAKQMLPLQAATTTALAALLAVGLTVADRLDRLDEIDRLEERAERALLGLDRLFSSLADAESALWGYILTEDRAQLETFERAVLATQGQLEALRPLVAGHAEQAHRLRAVVEPIQAYIQDMQGGAALARRQGFGAARESVRGMWRNKANMVRIRQDIAELQVQQQRLLEDCLKAKDADVRRTRLTLLGGGAFGTALLLASIMLLWRENLRRKSSDAASKAAHDDFRNFVQRSPIPMCVVDRYERIVVRNEQFLAVFGWDENEVPSTAQWWARAYPDSEYRAWVIKTWNAACAKAVREHRAITTMECRVACADGRMRDMEVSGVELERGFLVTFVDVTQRRQAEAELLEHREEAEAASRAKSAFLANMSHEIRTPMNAILGLTHLLAHDAATPQQSGRLAKISDAAGHLLSIINDILDLSKIEAGKLRLDERDFAPPALLEQVRSLVGDNAAAKGLLVHVECDGVAPWLRGDDTRVRQALLNYAGNAVKFTSSGHIILRAQLLQQQGDKALLRFEVEDTGVGIEPQLLPRLFEAFEQADLSTTREHGGTGLGLAITRRLARLMGGDVGAQRREGGGSVFWFEAWFKRGKPVQQAEPQRELAETELRLRHGGARVLVAEDNLVNREVALALLRAPGLEVDVAENGQAALQQLESRAYDLVLMDVHMPVLDGLQATRKLRTRPGLATLPVIALTASAFAEDRAECMAAGMSDFLAKPVNPQLLYETLLKWLPSRPVSAAGVDAVASPAPMPHDDVLARLAQHPGMDVAAALTRLTGLEHRYATLLRQFAGQHGRDGQRLAQCLAQQDWGGACFRAHALKGTAATLGATDLAASALALELRLREGCTDVALLRRLTEEVEHHLQPLVRLIEGGVAAAVA